MRRVAVIALMAAALLLWVAASWRLRASEEDTSASVDAVASKTSARPATADPSPVPTPSEGEAREPRTPAPTAHAATNETPKSTLRLDFERESRGADAAAAEDRIREVFASHPGNEGVLREVRCTETVCELQARWSQAVTVAYNAALVQLVGEFSRELSIEPDGEPDGTVVPVAILIRRASTTRPDGLAVVP